jgi:predicted ATPase
LQEAEFKDNESIYLVEKISIQHSIQVMPWLLAAFSQNYSENMEQKQSRKI